jgi:hypothetical protein
MQMLVGDIERGSRDGQGEERGYGGNGGPLCGRFVEEMSRDAAAGPENGKQSGELDEQLRPGQRDSSEADQGGHEVVKERGLHLETKEVGVVREERRVEAAFDGGEVDGVVFKTGVVAHDQEAECGEQQQRKGLVSEPVATHKGDPCPDLVSECRSEWGNDVIQRGRDGECALDR